MIKVAIVGSHGLYANYGGWDQLVINLVEKNESLNYIVFNSKESKKITSSPPNSWVIKLPFSASGIPGIIYDYLSIIICYIRKVDTILLLGNQGIFMIWFLKKFLRYKVRTVVNIGGIEWNRDKFNSIAKMYLHLAYKVTRKQADQIIFDNQYFLELIPKKDLNEIKGKCSVIPYGGELDRSLKMSYEIIKKYPFIKSEFYLSVSRAIPDNQIIELLETFIVLKQKLVLISNLSTSNYGIQILKKYQNKYDNIVLIDGLYIKPQLDLIRTKCKAYIHTHKNCGSAPSLIEMIHASVPIISFDVPQNRYTLNGNGQFFKEFKDLEKLLTKNNIEKAKIPDGLSNSYAWDNIVKSYQRLF